MSKRRKRRGDHTGAPAFYLREFVNEDRPTFLWEHDRTTGQWRTRGPSQVLKADNYYDVGKGDRRTSAIDEFMQQIESRAAPLFQAKSDGFIALRRQPTIFERERLAALVALMEVRSPQAHQTISNFLGGIAEKMARALFHQVKHDPEAFAQVRAVVAERTGITIEKAEDLDPTGLEFTGSKDHAVAMLVAHVDTVFKLVFNGPWSLLVAQGKDVFITSDRPFLRWPFAVADLGCDNYYFVIPLTRKMALAGHLEHGGQDRGFVPASTGLVTAINAEVWARATRYRFAPRKDFTGSEHVLAWDKRNEFLRKQFATLSSDAQRVVNVIWREFPPATVAEAEEAAEEAFKALRMFHGREDVEEAVGYLDALLANRHRLLASWAEPLRWWKGRLEAFAKELEPRELGD